ncbi:conserved hypothetical protein [Methanohalobium evestigatum Z-7303]|uniref:DUF8162 domain-containing protein n=1 Tax=Methanohalobium evestigatum (strain ATCC BAA-1072 / DSM 3721 / NBRC 107634 / OCM 161 / Z-7303) TaxID=644295 RepID=D7E6R5_METEZ|nr:hypothetical protein [Methanohalobium evestigatum]ADI73287.1 conserved hypothetical protein [Methanohalobium evestigatum Z-7303]
MSSLLLFINQVAGWFLFAIILIIPGIIAATFWTPFLVSERLRALFRKLPPTNSVFSSYIIAGISASLPYIIGFLVILAVGDVDNTQVSNSLITMSLLLFMVYTIGLPFIGVILLPRIGVDWDPHNYSVSTWILLAAGGAWYAILFTIPLAAFAFLLALPTG